MRELSLHILDLVQNSIEAGASKVALHISEDIYIRDIFIIRVIDDGRGMDEETCKKVIDPFVTTRKTRRIGLGLALAQMSTKQCNGYLTVTSKLGCGTTIEALYKHSHLDRPPLGSIVESIKSIVIANPELDFSYCHTANQVTFSLSTQEIIENLGNLPLTHPDILGWLHEYLTSNVMNLYKKTNLYGGG